jgi:hypothetical protein
VPVSKTVFDQGLGLFNSPEDAALLDDIVALAYEERRRPSKSDPAVFMKWCMGSNGRPR